MFYIKEGYLKYWISEKELNQKLDNGKSIEVLDYIEGL